MESSCIQRTKPELRRWAVRRRKQQTAESALRIGEALAERIGVTAVYKKARVVGIYFTAMTELSTQPLMELAWRDGKQIAVPAWSRMNKRYAFCRWTPQTAMGAGPMRIPQPATPEWISMSSLDLVLTPGLVFDRQGGRIGFGKGHYDRMLARCRPSAHFVALADVWQLVDSVPQTTTDTPLDGIATPSGIYWTGKKRIAE
jgi:5-formyltetrahydrofolate cyclo-ligase